MDLGGGRWAAAGGIPTDTLAASTVDLANKLFETASGEYLLNRPDVSNGGTVVLMRAHHSAVLIICICLLCKNALDPSRICRYGGTELEIQLTEMLPWFGTVVAATYVALYTRFASQWTYLAGVYNQIKCAECRDGCNAKVIAEWKAGFNEDAADIHLLRKKMFAATVLAWGGKPEVEQAFCEGSHGGKERFDKLMLQAKIACSSHQTRSAPSKDSSAQKPVSALSHPGRSALS